MPEIITREQWGARPPKKPPTKAPWLKRGALWVHYSLAPPPKADRDAEIQAVRNIQAFHMGPSRGWNDVGYGYIVAPSGRIYVGRGRDVVAAHCPGHNREASVCLLWKDGKALPPAEALASVLWLRDHLEMASLKAHREGTATSCPGDAIYKWVVANRTTPAPALTPTGPGKPPVAKEPRRIATRDGRVLWTGRFVNVASFIPALKKAIDQHGDVVVGNNK